MNEVIIAAIAAGLGSVITIVGKVIENIIKISQKMVVRDIYLCYNQDDYCNRTLRYSVCRYKLNCTINLEVTLYENQLR